MNSLILTGCSSHFLKMLVEGESVIYKGIKGVVAFVCEKSVSILISRGEHRSQDVKIVVYQANYDDIICLDEK